ncbi:uncharacterized protein LOC113685907 isoform X4 [Pocillopora damicornis]|uniref:uncharacterized protein LOC113685907 isoform X4 n=1 Tax=Pocillopora damicornis TaxID=46731 RepID=UPI000F554D7F|nr:uncharacterized protein LOC113685907 isoform X4 [Pocillopora damicornis]
MCESFFNSVVILFIWGNVTLVCVQCRSVPGTHFPDETKLTGQTELCLKRCGTSFHTDDTGTSSGELSSVQICYDKCLQERDDKNVSISEELTSSFKRIKREIPGSEKSSRDGKTCLMYSPGNFTFLEPKITFREPKDNGSFLGNVSWKPLSSDAFNWTGYRLIYVVGRVSQEKYKCVDFYKNETSYFINSGLPNNTRLRLMVVSIPFDSSKFEKLDIDCHIPCGEKPTTSGTSIPKTTHPTSPTSEIPGSGKSSKDGKTHPTSPTSESRRPTIIVLAIIPVTVIICAVSALLIFCYRLQKKASPGQLGSYKDMQFEYDAFVIYSSQDSEWVVKTLIPTLEEKHGLKCCVHYRDFPLGIPFRQNMVDSVYKSKKTVAVVSTHFFNSNYCGSELDYALHRLMEKKDDSLVVVKLDEVNRKKLPRELQKRSYIDFSKSTDKETWERKLVKCLRSTNPRPE